MTFLTDLALFAVVIVATKSVLFVYDRLTATKKAPEGDNP